MTKVESAYLALREDFKMLKDIGVTADNGLCILEKGGGIYQKFGHEKFTRAQLMEIAELLRSVAMSYRKSDMGFITDVLAAIETFNDKNKETATLNIKLASGYIGFGSDNGYYEVENIVNEGFSVNKRIRAAELIEGLTSGKIYIVNPKYATRHVVEPFTK